MKSFEIDHTKLCPGIYYHSKSGLVVTWDIRVKKPNGGDYLTPRVIHTIEHTLANYMRNRFGNYRIVGIFPMGCQTGFYVLTRFVSRVEIYQAFLDYIKDLQRIVSIPGSQIQECGQYDFHDLLGAKDAMVHFYDDHLRYSCEALNYNK